MYSGKNGFNRVDYDFNWFDNPENLSYCKISPNIISNHEQTIY